MMAEFPKEVTVEVNWIAAITKPGDTLIVGINTRIDRMQAQEIIDAITQIAPLVNVVVVDRVSSMVVHRPDADT